MKVNQHIPQIDGLRAIAVVCVLISHFGLGDSLGRLINLIPLGHLGVRLFFVISGFLITRILLERSDVVRVGRQSTKSALVLFYGRRFIRIFPIYYLTIAVAVALDVGNMREVAVYHLLYLSNIEQFAYSDFGGVLQKRIDPTSGHFWSLAVEEQFYIVWPALVLFLNRKNMLKLAIAMMFIAPLWRFGWFLAYPAYPSSSLFACVDSLGAGSILAFLLQRKQVGDLDWFLRYKPAIAVLGYAILSLCLLAGVVDVLYRPRHVLLGTGESIVFALLVFRCATYQGDTLSRLLESNVLQYIGKISYGVYVYHTFMSPLQIWIWRVIGLPALGSGGRSITLFLMTFIFAVASWHLIELPIDRLKKYVPRGPNS